MSALIVPAPLWRRLAAAVYDFLLWTGVWMIVLFVDVFVRDLFDLPRNWHALRAYFFIVGFAFFGWFWTHGGQTLGMRAWRLQLRTAEAGSVRWPAAALRYGVAYLAWGAALLGILWCLIDHRRRAWHDIAAGTEVVVLPRT